MQIFRNPAAAAREAQILQRQGQAALIKEEQQQARAMTTRVATASGDARGNSRMIIPGVVDRFGKPIDPGICTTKPHATPTGDMSSQKSGLRF
jgi:hypothetical protein